MKNSQEKKICSPPPSSLFSLYIIFFLFLHFKFDFLMAFTVNGGMKSSSTMEQIKLPTTNKPSTIRTNLNNNNNKETSVLPETSSQQSSSLSINGEATETTSIEFDENETPGDLSSTTTTTTTMSTTSTASTTITPKVCIVMGRSFALFFFFL